MVRGRWACTQGKNRGVGPGKLRAQKGLKTLWKHLTMRKECSHSGYRRGTKSLTNEIGKKDQLNAKRGNN